MRLAILLFLLSCEPPAVAETYSCHISQWCYNEYELNFTDTQCFYTPFDSEADVLNEYIHQIVQSCAWDDCQCTIDCSNDHPACAFTGHAP